MLKDRFYKRSKAICKRQQDYAGNFGRFISLKLTMVYGYSNSYSVSDLWHEYGICIFNIYRVIIKHPQV